MLKLNRDKLKGFVMGACIFALLASVGTAFADGKLTNINVVQGGLKLFVDGKLIKPTDSDGKIVEPFIYDGTTYLPLRALSNALTNNQKEVKWDGDTSSIYVGQAPVAAQTDIKEVKTYNDKDSYVFKEERAAFNILDKKITPFNRFSSYESFTYMLHSNYSQINGQLVVPYTNLGNTNAGGISFYNVDKKGNKTLIKSFKTVAGNDPVQVSVDVRGVEILEIQTYNKNANANSIETDGAFYNVTLAGIE
ncbi:copper amine oxidase N-terminal domain-containing protein [Paenibacillus radicis (ex Xue et al. 2023)]|uniref:Copper amine oxidase N-terminal domain-containing protein n=1 Tax=Paenibacillus radicis (ex Xue et al. 2023) TaxID=2972489 RepID=A0ABT1Y9U5_9BACL|nr:copper amine oxidase N-terminal domain-containing protein [Paenibacillus radicis (ex Xue et al. 2023)]MCR8629947.1 copper amine oxidase N-terminal domain-containing protein [Paenibacillus radicis (ex Xue et al. 2023)]